MGWQTLKVGGGGMVTGLSIANDGTMVVRTDTNGAYLWTGSQWQQLVTASSMPAAFDFTGDGVYEIQVAPSNSNVMYMTFGGYVFTSTNKGTTWTQTSFTPFNNADDPANDNFRWNGQKMAIDPNNPNIVYVGTPSNGLFVSRNGGSTWSSVSAIPDAAGEGIAGILFDPAVGGVVNGVTQTIFASSYGNGVYESTNGGSTWTKLSGGPTNLEYATVSSTGVYYASDGSNLWAYAGGAWNEVLSSSANDSQGIQAVAANPTNPNEIVVVAPSGYLDISYNAGATWSGPLWSSNEVTSADIPWLADAQQVSGGAANFLSVSGATFNPANPSQMILAGGTGVWTTTQVPTSASGSTTVTWSDQTAGLENLVAVGIIVPPGGDPVLASYDRAFFEITNPNAYPSTYSPVDSDTLMAGWSVDYASSTPSFIVGLAEWGTDESGYSTNGGQTWTQFATKIPGAGSSFLGGTIAASTPQNIVWAPAEGHQPYYTLNGGTTWNPIDLPGVSSWSGFDASPYYVQRSVTADRVQANTFYLYDPGKGVFETTNGGQSWSNVHPGYIESNSSLSGFNTSIQSVPGEAGNLFYTSGPIGTPSATPANSPFYRSTNGGATWTAVPNVLDVFSFGYGAAAPGQSYPAIYIVGYVSGVYGIWQSADNAQSWTNIGGANMPNGLDWIDAISGDPNHFGQVYVGFHGGGYAYLSASPTGGAPAAPTVTITSAAVTTSSAAQTITGMVDVADAGSTVTVLDGTTKIGTATVAANGAWSASVTLANQGANVLTATAANAAGTGTSNAVTDTLQTAGSGASNAPVAPTIPYGVVNSNGSVTLTGNAPGGSTVTVSDGGANPLATTTASSSFVWSYTTASLPAGAYAFTATDTTSAGTSAKSSALNVTVPTTAASTTSALAAPTIPYGVVNSNGSVTLTGNAPGGSTVTVSDGGANPLGTTTASSSFVWSYTTASLPAGAYAFTATDTTSAGTSAKSSALNVTVPTTAASTTSALAAPTIPYGVVNSNGSVTLTGNAPGGSTVTVSDGGANPLGTTTASSSFVWSYTTVSLPAGAYAFTATDTTSAGTSAKSSALNVTVPLRTAPAMAAAAASPAAVQQPAAAAVSLDSPIVTTKLDGSHDVAYSDVTGLSYSSYEDIFNSAGVQVAEARDMVGGAGMLILDANHLTVSSSSGSFAVTTGSDTFKVNSHANELIDASGRTAETFEFGSGFGHQSITGLLASGATHDVIELPPTMFRGLNSMNTAAQNWNALLSSGATVQSGGNVTITDAAHDVLTLNNITTSMLSNSADNVFKFA